MKVKCNHIYIKQYRIDITYDLVINDKKEFGEIGITGNVLFLIRNKNTTTVIQSFYNLEDAINWCNN